MVNLKGEVVKRPEVNIQKENWAQFLELAKEYGLTAKSGKILKLNSNEEEDSAFDKFVKGGIERR
jgi:phage terminase small subunit